MKIGRMDARIGIEARTETADAMGTPVVTWTSLATVWSERWNLKGSEKYESGTLLAESEVRFRVRYSATMAGVTGKHRVTAGAEVFDIVGKPIAIPAGRPEYLEIYAKSSG